MASQVFDLSGLDALIGVLRADGRVVVGPLLRDDAITLAEVKSATDLPSGWGVEIGPGHYRVRRRTDTAVFGHSAGPQSWKRFLHPPHRTLMSSDSSGFHAVQDDTPDYAFLGVRACDLAAIGKLRQITGGRAPFVVAAQCTEPGEVCFCTSMGCGPAAGPGYDIALTERIDEQGQRFLATSGTAEGAAVLARVPAREAVPEDIALAEQDVDAAARNMGRAMPELDLRDLLAAGRDSAHWEAVAERCLTCGNCTMVCPTCFCVSVEDHTDLDGNAERAQRWASCFEIDFSYLHGGAVRTSGAARYRQWMTHKLGTWHDQFGTSGCVGCGRCIAWCPAGIDITEEAAVLSQTMKHGGDRR
ncbi:4Fe-4S dicluster domain-containing protein [Lentzea waywayandensis]|uniref:4Fe-4S dicluster domain-containing protein n=1 Tax=Lentzea waywayandensis TaxID=84724 RepID=A0A1I6D9J8_9PSEU|nr:4Fe-4S dicluster domain-containing protein [Lentzea waywayandensis]SFR02119.1 4Fe-4S dicluster domain-containing protein [Lentzea waywayandensis]